MGLFSRKKNKIEVGNAASLQFGLTAKSSSEKQLSNEEHEEQILEKYITAIDDGSGNLNIQHRTDKYTTLYYGDVLWIARVKWTDNVQWVELPTLQGVRKESLKSEDDILQYADLSKEFYIATLEAERKRQEKLRKKEQKQ